MERYRVRLSPRAIDDLQISFDWGIEFWGREKAMSWVEQVQHLIKTGLSSMPERCPIAPESSEFDIEIRQLKFHRYRILFTISDTDRTVYVLRIRGPFNGRTLELD